ncbi:(4Fe-4S)-binding protein [Roseivirga sp. E12]|uniref:(4Fe-4S)-binding protein n=1 Tax=Roseivirga sp. E12 TaxID=2819237 RepID=UPI001ABCE99D|nr:(4Fe-4S)-binding protein [Roseivirga sp. E12]MBO3697508.1 (4Fe-4S)-binding protein [Roseivirga sp. E12]
MGEQVIKEYTNDEVTVVWKPEQCIHSGICLRGLPKVFNLKQRPWVSMTSATSQEIVSLVRECPSKALSIKGVRFKEDDKSNQEVTLIPGGPLIVKGGATVHERKETKLFHETVSFCRCNRSKNFPYCDGTHAQPKDN